MDKSDVQDQNADLPSFESREPDSNATFDRVCQSWKQDSEMVSIDEGMHMDWRETNVEVKDRSKQRIDKRVAHPLIQAKPLGNSCWPGNK
jgi:hypothetical protein